MKPLKNQVLMIYHTSLRISRSISQHTFGNSQSGNRPSLYISHMMKYVTLFTRLNKVKESRTYVVVDFPLDVVGLGDIA
jgi:hypothetical protein